MCYLRGNGYLRSNASRGEVPLRRVSPMLRIHGMLERRVALQSSTLKTLVFAFISWTSRAQIWISSQRLLCLR